MVEPIRTTNFVPEWIDMGPKIPVPRIDWIREKQLDISYGTDPLQKYDLYYPNERPDGPLPLVIIVHGGGFSHMDKRDWHLYPGFFALREGFAVASVNYRLAPKNKFPEGLWDVRDAVLHLKQHAGEYGVDPERFFLYGTSAGGNLVSLLGLKAEEETADYRVRGVAALCPAVDLCYTFTKGEVPLFMHLLFRHMKRSYLGKRHTEQKKREASANSYIGKQIPPFYIQQGDKDPAVPVRMAREFHAQLQAAGAPPDRLVLDILEGAAHAGGGPDFLEERNILPVLQFFKSL